jgi:hypothetical protein
VCQKPSEHLRSELKWDHVASDFKCKQIGATRSRTYFRSPALTSVSYGYALSRERLAVLENDALLRLDDQASTASP